jgi:hypothetical protein
MPSRRHELTPVLFATATDGDRVARAIVERQADEVVANVMALIRLEVLDEPTPVLLGGGVLAARHPQLNGMITDLLAGRAPKAAPQVVTAGPVLGAALLGWTGWERGKVRRGDCGRTSGCDRGVGEACPRDRPERCRKVERGQPQATEHARAHTRDNDKACCT